MKKVKIKCVETNTVYESAVEAAQELNINSKSITMCANGKQKSAGGYTFIKVNGKDSKETHSKIDSKIDSKDYEHGKDSKETHSKIDSKNYEHGKDSKETPQQQFYKDICNEKIDLLVDKYKELERQNQIQQKDIQKLQAQLSSIASKSDSYAELEKQYNELLKELGKQDSELSIFAEQRKKIQELSSELYTVKSQYERLKENAEFDSWSDFTNLYLAKTLEQLLKTVIERLSKYESVTDIVIPTHDKVTIEIANDIISEKENTVNDSAVKELDWDSI